MSADSYFTGLQHIGIPTKEIQKTIEFYKSLGFKTAYQTSDGKVAFLQSGNVMIEAYQVDSASETAGAIDHIALNVKDIGKVFVEIKAGPYKLLHDEIQYLPFWKNGVKFFTIQGPNNEKVEFNQIL